MPQNWPFPRGFLPALLPSAFCGWILDTAGVPLGWLMGAAMVTAAIAMSARQISVPKPFQAASQIAVGAVVGLSITPEVAAEILAWAPAMLSVALVGMACATTLAPLLARWGRMKRSTAYFSLLPAGVFEMASIGESHGANPAIISALHSLRVALVVVILPLVLLAFSRGTQIVQTEQPVLPAQTLIAVLAIGTIGGFGARRLNLAAAWLLGALVVIATTTAIGVFSGRFPGWLMPIAQIMFGMTLGARFNRNALAAIPRALAAGIPAVLAMIAIMAVLAGFAGLLMPHPLPTLVLSFSIGGMTEMILTAEALNQNVALIAAFQALRVVIVNAMASIIWRWISSVH